jgi:SAM-dependent methyltransferase
MSFPGTGRADQAGTSAGSVWDRQAGGYHRFFSQFTIPVAHPLLDAARVTAGSSVLDAGAGPGYAARAARARGARVVAVDLSADMLARARRADPLLPLLRADAGALPIAGGSFTAVVASFYLPHLADPATGTAELARALAPGGWLAASVWDVPARARHTGLLADAIAEVTGTPPPVPAVPAGRLRELLHAAGLDHADCSTVRWAHPLPSAQALWDGLLASPVAAAATVRRATPATQHRIHERFLALADGLTDPQGTVRLPVSAVIAAAQQPPASSPRRPRGYRPTAPDADWPRPGTP